MDVAGLGLPCTACRVAGAQDSGLGKTQCQCRRGAGGWGSRRWDRATAARYMSPARRERRTGGAFTLLWAYGTRATQAHGMQQLPHKTTSGFQVTNEGK